MTGLTHIGSLFAVSTLGSLMPLLSAQNGFAGGYPTKFLPISPHITGEDAPQQHHYSIQASSVDPLISISDGYLIFLIKLPDLRFNSRYTVNPLLSKLLSVCEEQLNQAGFLILIHKISLKIYFFLHQMALFYLN